MQRYVIRDSCAGLGESLPLKWMFGAGSSGSVEGLDLTSNLKLDGVLLNLVCLFQLPLDNAWMSP